MSDQVFPDVVLRTQRLVLRAPCEEDVAGFTYEGTARNAGIVHAGRLDLAVYSLIPEDLRS